MENNELMKVKGIKERPIIFNAEMVRAVLEGRKTQTRRICSEINPSNFPACLSKRQWAKVNKALPMAFGPDYFCPFGAVGDRLWVREAFRVMGRATDVARLMYKASERNSFTESTRTVPIDQCNKQSSYNWTPSIHMPRWASRITLEITGVRVERLQAVSEADAQAEGVQLLRGGFWRHYQPEWTHHQLSARGSFVSLWQSIYGADSWQANPWVWVIEFKRVEGE